LSETDQGASARSFGAAGDGRSLDGPAIQAAIDAAGAAGGGEIVLPPGGYVSGSLRLRDGVSLRLEAGAVLLGSLDPRDYPPVETMWEGRPVLAHSPLLGATGARGVRVRGGGAIDGRGELWWRLFREGALAMPRPRLLGFDRCDGVLLEGFEAWNSPSWAVHPLRSRNVSILGLRISSPPDSPNTDGIDPESCSSVRIADCRISVGDDCVAIKSGAAAPGGAARGDEGPGEACEKVEITGCVFERGHGGVVIGSEMSGGVRDVEVSDCRFLGTDRGIRMKTRRGRGGRVERISARGLVMEGVLCPIAINSHYGCGAWDDPLVSDLGRREVGEGTPSFEGISFSRIEAKGALIAAAWIDGLAESPIRGLSFDEVAIEMSGDAPPGGPAQAEMSALAPKLALAGFRISNVSGLRLRRVSIRGQAGPAYLLSDCEGLLHESCDPPPC
jgi:polygalacturonase